MELRPGYQGTDIGTYPSDWTIGKLGDLDPFVTSGSRGWARYYSDRGSVFLRITNLSRSSIYPDLADLKYVDVPPSEAEAIRTRLLDGDMLVSITADIGIVGYVDASVPKPAYINQHIALVRFDGANGSSKFLAYFLASDGPQRFIASTTDRGAKTGISLTGVLRIKTALPSVSEQEAIAGALSDADGLIQSLEQLIAKKCQIKQGAMQELLTGNKRLQGFSGDWAAHILRDGITLFSGQHVLARYCNSEGKGVPYITGPADFPDGAIRRCSFTERPTTIARKGDILVTVKGSGVGTMVFCDGTYCISRQLMAVRVREQWDSAFVYFALLKGAPFISSAAAGLIPGISRRDLLESPIRVPLLAEQRAIAAVLSALNAEIDTLERKLDKARHIKTGMMQELLTGKIRLI